MFYKLMLASMLFCVSAIASNDIRDLDSFKASFFQVITSNSTNKIEYIQVKFLLKKVEKFYGNIKLLL